MDIEELHYYIKEWKRAEREGLMDYASECKEKYQRIIRGDNEPIVWTCHTGEWIRRTEPEETIILWPSDLHAALKQAEQSEDYEYCAKLRDRIKEVEG